MPPHSNSSLANWDGGLDPPRQRPPPAMRPPVSNPPTPADTCDARSSSAPFTPVSTSSSPARPSSTESEERVRLMLLDAPPQESPVQHLARPPASATGSTTPTETVNDVYWGFTAAQIQSMAQDNPVPGTSSGSSTHQDLYVHIRDIHAHMDASNSYPTFGSDMPASVVPPLPRYTDEERAAISVEQKMDELLFKAMPQHAPQLQRDVFGDIVLLHKEGTRVSVARFAVEDAKASDDVSESVTATDSHRELSTASALEQEPARARGTPESSLPSLTPTPRKTVPARDRESILQVSRSFSLEIIESSAQTTTSAPLPIVSRPRPQNHLRTHEETSRTSTRTSSGRPRSPLRQSTHRRHAQTPVSVSSSSSQSSSPPLRRRPHMKAEVLVRTLSPDVKKKYLPLSQIRSSEAEEDIPNSSIRPARGQRANADEPPLSPTVSDYAHPEPSRNPRYIVPSSVSPPASPRDGPRGSPPGSWLSPSPDHRRPPYRQAVHQPARSTGGRVREPSLEADLQQAVFASDLAAAILAANTMPLSGTYSDAPTTPPKARKSGARPGKRKATSPPPVAGPSRPSKKQETRRPNRAAAVPQQSLHIEARDSSPSPSCPPSVEEFTLVTYGLGDDIIGQCLTRHTADIDVSESSIEERIPNPERLQKYLVSTCRHVLNALDIEPSSLLSGSRPSKAHEAPRPVEEDDGYTSPPRMWDNVQAARARNAKTASPTRPKRAKRKRASSGARVGHLPPEQNRPTAEAGRANGEPPQADRPHTPPATGPAAPQDTPAHAQMSAAPVVAPDNATSRNDVHSHPYATFHSDLLPSQGLSYNYMLSRYNGYPSDVVRGTDAFLGGHIGMDEDMRMDVDDDPFGRPPGAPGLYEDGARWLDPAQAPPTTVSMAAVYAGGDGTIDPSLLGPATPPRLRSPEPQPTPPSVRSARAPSEPLAGSEEEAEWVPRPRGVGQGKGKGKGKGKERAADVGYRARAPDASSPTGRAPVEEATSGKRPRKPSARALEAHAYVEALDAGKSAGRAKAGARSAEEGRGGDDEGHAGSGAKLSDSKILQLVQEIPYCHQCRGQNKYDKMRCSVLKEGGVPCGVYYCEKCIRARYEHIHFDAFARAFRCPRCAGTCNCTSCCRRRGVPYVSARGQKIDVAFSTLYTGVVLRKSTKPGPLPAAAAGARPRRGASGSAPTPPSALQVLPQPKKKKARVIFELSQREREMSAAMALPAGAVWGTVYGVGMDRIGTGVVADGESIVVRREPDAVPAFARVASRPTAESSTEEEEEEEEETEEEEVGEREAVVDNASPERQPVPSYYVGKLQPLWTELPDKLKGLSALPAPRHAVVGSRAVVVTYCHARGLDIDVRRAGGDGRSRQTDLERAFDGELTPVPEDADPRGACEADPDSDHGETNVTFAIASALQLISAAAAAAAHAGDVRGAGRAPPAAAETSDQRPADRQEPPAPPSLDADASQPHPAAGAPGPADDVDGGARTPPAAATGEPPARASIEGSAVTASDTAAAPAPSPDTARSQSVPAPDAAGDASVYTEVYALITT